MNPYQALEIDKTAQPAEIEKAYRKKSLKHHPDRGGDVEEFKRVKECYEILADPERRKKYDETGETEQPRKQSSTPAESVIASLLAEAFAQDSRDPVRWMASRIAARRADHETQRDKMENGKKKLQRRIDQFRKKNEHTRNTAGRDFVLEALEGGVIGLNQEIEAQEGQVRILTEALTLLNDLQGGGEDRTGWGAESIRAATTGSWL